MSVHKVLDEFLLVTASTVTFNNVCPNRLAGLPDLRSCFVLFKLRQFCQSHLVNGHAHFASPLPDYKSPITHTKPPNPPLRQPSRILHPASRILNEDRLI